ncbi:MAG: hypothetical protein KCHDKBKB_03126 [Elusimicrobia bacterium]|nr:hypothetical protein [Elusimicrobiota bacterium]
MNVEAIMALPENELDVGRVALNLAREFYPDLNVSAYSKQIDRLAGRVHKIVGDSQDPDKRIDALNAVLFQQERFDYDLPALADGRHEPGFLNHLLDTKQGNCLSLPVLYMAIAQRLGYPIYPVSAPSHSFLRYVQPDSSYCNIEATSNGDSYGDDVYAESFSLTEKSLKTGGYLRTLSYREFLACLLQKNANVYAKKGQTEKAVFYLEKALSLDPLAPDVLYNLANDHSALSVFSKGLEAKLHLEKYNGYHKRMKELGFVALTETAVWKTMREKLRS